MTRDDKMFLINNIAVAAGCWGISRITGDSTTAVAIIVLIGFAAYKAPNGPIAHLLAAWVGIFHRIAGIF